MPFRYLSAFRSSRVGALSWRFTDPNGTFNGTLSSSAVFCHEASTGWTVLSSNLQTAMDAATPATVTVAYNSTTGAYTIATNAASFSLDFTGPRAPLGRALGFSTTAVLTGATSYTSTLTPYYVLFPAGDSWCDDPFPYDQEEQVIIAVSDDGYGYSNGPSRLVQRRTYRHQFQPKSLQWSAFSSPTVPWTWDLWWAHHGPTQEQMLVAGTPHGSFTAQLTQGEQLKSTRAMAALSLDAWWHVSIDLRVRPVASVNPPVLSSAPVISGTVSIGQLLSSTTGSWANTPTSYSYQWRRDGVSIGGATSSTYTLVAADVGPSITCDVVAMNVGGSSSPATSNALTQTIGGVLGTKLKALHLQAGLVVGTGYSNWTDASLTAFHWAQPTTSQQPATGATINGRPAPNFDGADDLMTSGASGKYWQDLNGNAGAELFVICRADTLPADNALPYLASAIVSIVSAYGELTLTTSGFRYTLNDGANKSTAYIAASTGTDYYVNARHDGTNIRLAVGATVGATVACGAISTTNLQCVLGANYNGSAYFDGRVGAFVAANGTTITAGERADVAAILAYLYAVTTP